MLYLGKWRRALAYFGLAVLLVALPFPVAHLGLLPISAETAVDILTFVYGFAGAIHCYLLAKKQGDHRPTVWFARWYVVVAFVVFLVGGLIAIRLAFWEPFNIGSSSMEPGLLNGDVILVSKLAYDVSEPRRGDLAVFLSPEDDAAPYAKRLVGLPGDRLQLKAGALYLNDERVPREEVEEEPEEGHGRIYREILPGGRSYLVREVSDRARFDNTGVFEIPPGHYFFLGDNRDNSLDSRMMIGFVPHENLIGRADVILWNSRAQRLRVFDPD